MEKNIKFKEGTKFNSQQTIVKVLKDKKYEFEPINEYQNTLFYCVTLCEDPDWLKDFLSKLFGWAGFKYKKRYVKCPLMITVCGGLYPNSVYEPIVFNREEVEGIISDLPENYVGEEIL